MNGTQAVQRVIRIGVVDTAKPLPHIPSTIRPTLPRSASSPLLKAQIESASNLSTKRKPLPKDSPLLVPLSEHPAFANILQSKALDEKQNRQDLDDELTCIQVDEQHSLNELEVSLPLPPTPIVKLRGVRSTRMLR